MRLCLAVSAVVAAILPVTCCVQAAVEVVAEGVAALVEGDNAGRIRDEAIDDALRRAVEIGVGAMVRSETLMENYAVVRDVIWSATAGYVQTYDVLRETTDDTFFRITIRAWVDVLALGEELDELGLEIELIGNPRIAVIIEEWICENEPGAPPVCSKQPFSIAGDLIEAALHEKGFTLVDAGRIAELTDEESIGQAAQGDAAAAAALARALDADITLAGNLRAEPAGVVSQSGFDWHKALATLSAQVILRDTGEVISSSIQMTEETRTSFSSASREALSAAAEAAVPELIIETIASLNLQDDELLREIRVHITGVPGFSEAVALEAALGSIRGVEGVDLRVFEAGIAALDVQFLGTTIELAQLLEAPWFQGRMQTELDQTASLRIASIDFGSIEATFEDGS